MRSSDLETAIDYIFTLGHSNISFEQLLNQLRVYEIEAVADVRSQPYSKYSPHFNRNALNAQLEDAGITYEFMGHQLGGRPDGQHFYDEQGHVRYDKWSEDERFLDGIAILESIAKRRRWAILCSEGDARACHRHLLLARVLASHGWPKTNIIHIEPDGTCISEDSLPEQPDLFGGTVSWRSPLSVLQRVQPSTSSNDLTEPEFGD
ncbi:MAG: DUF488 domain-containing protein [Chloroflexi bacterium]|nr:DUF488 domain-containing protein [Chloroflexota bacterium]